MRAPRTVDRLQYRMSVTARVCSALMQVKLRPRKRAGIIQIGVFGRFSPSLQAKRTQLAIGQAMRSFSPY